MTWNDLAKKIAEMPPERREDDAVIFDNGQQEFYPINDKVECNDGTHDMSNVLDIGHYFLHHSLEEKCEDES